MSVSHSEILCMCWKLSFKSGLRIYAALVGNICCTGCPNWEFMRHCLSANIITKCFSFPHMINTWGCANYHKNARNDFLIKISLHLFDLRTLTLSDVFSSVWGDGEGNCWGGIPPEKLIRRPPSHIKSIWMWHSTDIEATIPEIRIPQGPAQPALFAFPEKKTLLETLASSWVTKSPKVSGSLCSAPLADSGTVSLRAQKYSAESLQWAEGFLRWKEVSLLLNSASKPLMPETRLFPDVYFRRSWSPWLGYCTYQKR